MNTEYKILLSIGIIFKNEIRCLERCLKSLQPLRDAIPCELVMADTGATDGSRQVAEKYADILFDFTWIDDFAAARNAVMDRCSGKWYLSIDCDEWLGGDVRELISLVRDNVEYKYAGITIRNYKDTLLEKSSDYTDFTACRLMRMCTGLRYVGKIHERWPSELQGTQKLLWLQRCFLHHDGYLYSDPVATKEKLDRNMALLREHLEKDPQDLVTLLQCIESSEGTPENITYIEKAVQGIEEKWQGWSAFGPPILRYAAIVAFKNNKPELEPCIDMAREQFPTSMYTRVDTEFSYFGLCWQRSEYQKCIQSGERYLKALADYEAGKFDPFDSLCSTLSFVSLNWKLQVQVFMAASYLYEKRPARTSKILNELDYGQMTAKHVGDCVRVYTHLHSRSLENTAPLITKLWNDIGQPTPSEERAVQRKTEFIRMASEVFLPAYRETESSREDFCRHAYTLFLPLEGKCVLGDAAAILETEDPAALERKVRGVTDLEHLPIHALYHALERGVSFPPADKPLKMEEMDMLAGRLAQDSERLSTLARSEAKRLAGASVQRVTWVRGVAMAAVRSFDWKNGWGGEALARAYAAAEQAFLSVCYAPGVLCEENLDVLPPLHRFGWYLPQAFQALDGGDAIGYTRILRKGISVCESMKPMVEFLLEHTPELQTQPEPSAELKALADQIRTILANYSPDDPAVAKLKQSEAYQKVAYLIEGIEAPVIGGRPQ